MLTALFSALLVSQSAGPGPVQTFYEACLATAGQASRLEALAEIRGWTRHADEAPMFEDADGVLVYSAGAVTIRLEVFDAVSEWVDAPPTGEALRSLLRSGRAPSKGAQVLREAPATAICMIDFDEADDDVLNQIEQLTVDGRQRSEIDHGVDFRTHKWRVNGSQVLDVQYVQAVRGRDEPGTKSGLSANFRL